MSGYSGSGSNAIPQQLQGQSSYNAGYPMGMMPGFPMINQPNTFPGGMNFPFPFGMGNYNQGNTEGNQGGGS